MKRQLNEICETLIDGYVFNNDKSWLDLPYIYAFLSQESYWAKGIPLETVRASIAGSYCFGIYRLGTDGAAGKGSAAQVGFCRVVSDAATFGYLADVFVDPAERGAGLSKRLMEFVFSFDEVKRFRRFMLGTKDAHGLYAQFGFKGLAAPERFMEIHNPY